jgi:hypothetical protein
MEIAASANCPKKAMDARTASKNAINWRIQGLVRIRSGIKADCPHKKQLKIALMFKPNGLSL